MKKEMVEKIESEITQRTKLPDDIKEQARKNIFTNIIIAIIAISYFIFLILGSVGTTKNTRIVDFNIFSIIILGLAICLFEIAYKKDNGAIAMYGVEALIIALTTLFLPYVIFEVSEAHKKYYLMVSSYIGIYYIIKCIYISVKIKKKYLEEASDIKEIVKKENKRRNVQYEEEKTEDTQKVIEKVEEDKKESLKSEEKGQIEETKKEKKPAKKENKTTKAKKTTESTKKSDKKEETNTSKKRGRPKKEEVKETKQNTESIVSKTKSVKKKESIKEEIKEESKPKKRGRPKKQETAQEKTKEEEQKNNNVPKKRGRPRKVVTAND
jgi:multisubunit Na+/H+ antiporter MnhF subunit